MKTNTVSVKTIKNLKRQHSTQWLAFTAKVDATLAALGARMGVNWNSTEDITEHVNAEDFVAGGFSQEEADTMIFVLTEDCMGQSVNSAEMIERWFCYCA